MHMTGKDFTEQSTVNSLNLLPKTSIQDAGYKIAISFLLFPLDAGGCDVVLHVHQDGYVPTCYNLPFRPWTA